jgi:hypothetical protein
MGCGSYMAMPHGVPVALSLAYEAGVSGSLHPQDAMRAVHSCVEP